MLCERRGHPLGRTIYQKEPFEIYEVDGAKNKVRLFAVVCIRANILLDICSKLVTLCKVVPRYEICLLRCLWIQVLPADAESAWTRRPGSWVL